MRLLLLLLLLAAVTYVAAQTADPLVIGVPTAVEVRAGQWRYFSVDTTDAYAELNIYMTQTSLLGDPDLYIRMGELPTGSDFDRHDISTALNVTVAVRTTDAVHPLRVGRYYIGVFGFGNTNSAVRLTAQLWNCPNDCSGPEHGHCNAATKLCTCTGIWDTKEQDCSSSVVVIEPDSKTAGFIDRAVTRYYNFTVTTSVLQVVVNVARSRGDSPAAVMLAQNRWPTTTDNDAFALDGAYPSTGYNLIVERGTRSRDLTGRWTIAVSSLVQADFSYLVTYFAFNCPAGCNKHGTCGADHKCTCDEGWQGTPDCSMSTHSLTAGTTFNVNIGSFREAYYKIALPAEVNTRRMQMHVKVTADPAHGLPRVYLNPDDVPSRVDFWAASPLPVSSISEARIAAGYLGDLNETTWYVMVDNPNPDDAVVAIFVEFVAHCVHGTSQSTGLCVCNEGWQGEDCSSEPPAGVRVGVAVGLSLLLFAVGAVVGFFIKRQRPQCCGAKAGAEMDTPSSDLAYARA